MTIKKLFLVSRPISWLNTAYPFVAGYILAGGPINALFIISTLFFLGPYNLLMYGVNDVFDYESDIRNPRKGGIEGMREQRQFHPVIIRVILTVCIPFVVLMVWLGTVVSAVTLLAVLFFVVAYSVAKLRFKERPLLDSVTSSLHFVGPLLFALSLTRFTNDAWPYVIAFFLWGVASHAVGAVQDIIPDRKASIASVATFFGARWTMRGASLLYVIASLIMLAMPYAVMGVVGLAYVLNIARFVNVSDKQSATANKAWRRFIWLNYIAGFILTVTLLAANL